MFATQKIHYSFKHQDLISRLSEITEKFKLANDNENTSKMFDLIDKFKREEIILAFCGHFSSGKSSIINRLIGSDILPTSPIPQKSNIVKILAGKSNAKVYLKDHTVQEFSFDDDISKLQNYCLDMENVDNLEIFHDIKDNENFSKLTLMDTPGVDSIEDAKNIVFDTSLYLSDAIIYVMDYNHVQSEVNFNFTKLFKDLGKPVYLVINQIDKHCDFEIDFDFFKDSVVNAFDSWNIKTEGIYFISLTEDSHPENQLQALRTKIASLVVDKDSIMVKSTVDATIALIKAHILKLEENNYTEKEAYLNVVQDVNIEEIKKKLSFTKAKINQLENEVNTFEREIRKEVFALLEESRLTPYQTTELARDYLESCKEGFRVGLLFAGKKTEQEVNKRLMELYKDFTEKVTANLDWHLKELLRKIPEKYKYVNEEYLNMLYSLNVEVTPEMLQATVNDTAVGSREYVINYCKDISADIKSQYRKKINDLLAYLLNYAQNKISSALTELNEKRLNFEKVLEAANQLALLDVQSTNYHILLRDILLGRTA